MRLFPCCVELLIALHVHFIECASPAIVSGDRYIPAIAAQLLHDLPGVGNVGTKSRYWLRVYLVRAPWLARRNILWELFLGIPFAVVDLLNTEDLASYDQVQLTSGVHHILLGGGLTAVELLDGGGTQELADGGPVALGNLGNLIVDTAWQACASGDLLLHKPPSG